MPSVCIYFQVHQPIRLRKYSYFNIRNNDQYFDDKKNIEILNKVSEKCYLPTNQILNKLIEENNGKFKISYSISGILIEQLEKHRKDVLDSFIQLSSTGCVEFLSETYAHSLSSVYSEKEFIKQIEKQNDIINKYFNQTPKVFRNTELIYKNEIGEVISKLGFKAMLCEGTEKFLGKRTPNHIYNSSTSDLKLLLKNYKLSDDIAFRFSNKDSGFYPLTTEIFSNWIHKLNGNAEVINLFMDYETFGEHQWKHTGIFDFLKKLPSEILKNPEFNFKTPSECIEFYPTRGEYDVPEYLSWADTERDLSAWISNVLQTEALRKLYALEKKVNLTDNDYFIKQFEQLQTSDHFYYMCTKFWNDGDVHKYFSPFESPYEAYIYFMNCITDFTLRIDEYLTENNYSTRSVQIENGYPQASVIKATN